MNLPLKMLIKEGVTSEPALWQGMEVHPLGPSQLEHFSAMQSGTDGQVFCIVPSDQDCGKE